MELMTRQCPRTVATNVEGLRDVRSHQVRDLINLCTCTVKSMQTFSFTPPTHAILRKTNHLKVVVVRFACRITLSLGTQPAWLRDSERVQIQQGRGLNMGSHRKPIPKPGPIQANGHVSNPNSHHKNHMHPAPLSLGSSIHLSDPPSSKFQPRGQFDDQGRQLF